MASISSTSSLGNTSLRGFGGMVSGIERDEIIEQMTLGTTTKINNTKNDITKLQWKQEAYRSVSDKIIGLSDDYFSYSSSSSLVDATFFAKNQVMIHGSDKSSKYVTASGSSDLVDNISIRAVEQLATASVFQSKEWQGGALKTTLSDLNQTTPRSELNGTRLTFGVPTGKDDKYQTVTFEFPGSYEETDADGKVIKHSINYTPKDDAEWEKLAEDLTKALHSKNLKLGEKEFKDVSFQYDTTQKAIKIVGLDDKDNIEIMSSSSALKALGYENTGADDKRTIKMSDFNAGVKDIASTAISNPTILEEIKGSKLAFNYNGTQKQIELVTQAEFAELEALSGDKSAQLQKLAENIQGRLDKAFGKDNVQAKITDGTLQFTTKDPKASISVVSGDTYTMQGLGISYGESNKVNLSGKLDQATLNINLDDSKYADGLVINGVKIEGITKNSSISSILSKINASDAGVKATYVDATGQFMLVANETGTGREIKMDSQLAKDLFGDIDKSEAKFEEGQNARIVVSYGNGVDVTLDRASNTFDLEGLKVTVSGTFTDPGDEVSFTAKADVDGVTERVKKFIEDFNAMVTEVATEIRTRPDSSYGPLSDEQKAEMTETSIENWEKKAKQGMLYGDSNMRDLSSDLEGIFVKLMNSGASYEDLKKIGINYSDDYLDGGTLSFDEAKFRSAMESEPELVSNIFTGGGGVTKGLTKIVEETLTPYATRYASRNGNSYGRLIEEAGSTKAPTTVTNNFIYNQIKEMQEKIESLQSKLKTEQDRYIKQFSTMESLISQFNSQSSWLSQISG